MLGHVRRAVCVELLGIGQEGGYFSDNIAIGPLALARTKQRDE